MITFLFSVARVEGFYLAGSRPNRNNNPGDLEYGPFAVAHGATGSDGRFAIFVDASDGFAAMRALFLEPARFNSVLDDQGEEIGRKLVGGYLGATVAEALNRYAPPVENRTSQYVATVCQLTGLTPDTVLTETNLG